MTEKLFIEKMIGEMQARLKYLKNQEDTQQKKLVNSSYKTTIILDAGHGGISPEDKYVTAPNKMWTHKKGCFHDGKTFFEGVFNRIITSKLVAKFQEIGMPYYVLSHEWKDTPLHTRSWRANQFHAELRKDKKQAVLFSIHGNAFTSPEANGWSVFVSPNASQNSKKLATNLAENFQKVYPEIPLRTQYANLLFFTANFHILRETNMPAILSENLFFTNYEDAVRMMSEKFQDDLVDFHLQTALYAQEL